jgi:hypothetical protein
LTGDLSGANTYLQNGNDWDLPSPKCIDYMKNVVFWDVTACVVRTDVSAVASYG